MAETERMSKLWQRTLHVIIFICLVVSCYFFYMKEAIEKYQRGATTVTRRSTDIDFEIPALTICANPPFKPSVAKLYNLEFPTRDLFTTEWLTNDTENIHKARLTYTYLNGSNSVHSV